MLKLKTLEESDLVYRVNLLNDERIAPYINTSEKFTIDKTKEWFYKLKENNLRKDFTFIGDKEKIGMGGLTNISQKNSHCELYMYLDPNVQGKGFGYKTCKALCEFAFNELNLNKVFLYTFSNNERANKLYEKLGFKLEGTLRKHTLKDGVFQDRYIYGIFRNELN